MGKEKKKWESPKLVCLYRGKDEEAVLTTCKTTEGATGPDGICSDGRDFDCDKPGGT